MAINNDGITFNMTEHIDMLNEKTVGGGGYAIPKEYIVQKYLKERINPEIPTATILAALDTRVFEDKAMASAQALMGGPQKSVFEETITETETVMPQGIAQGQPQQRPPMPGQMPRQMAGLQRPPMPGRVPPQRQQGIPVMAAAGGYVPNFADGGIIGYKELGYVDYKPTFGLKKMQGYSSPKLSDLPPTQEADAYSRATQYINDATAFNEKGYEQIYGEERVATEPGGRYSKVGQFFRGPQTNTQAELDAKDYQRAKNQIRQEIRDTKTGPFEVLSDAERGVAVDKINQLEGMLTEIEALESGESVTEKDGTQVDVKKDTLVGDANNKRGENKGAVGIGPGTNAALKSFMDSQNNQTEEEYQTFLDKQKQKAPGQVSEQITEESLMEQVYGPDGRPEFLDEKSFTEQLTGEGSAFADQQATTKEFRDDLNKRADKAIMSTDELMLRAGLGLMSSDKPAGRELQAIGEIGTGLTNEFIKRGDKADTLRDKARMLDTQLNKQKSDLKIVATKFGESSKQFKAKEKQLFATLDQKERLFKEGEAGKTDRAKITGRQVAMAAQQKRENDAQTFITQAKNRLFEKNMALKTTMAKLTDTKQKLKDSDIIEIKRFRDEITSYYNDFGLPTGAANDMHIKQIDRLFQQRGIEGEVIDKDVVNVSTKEDVNNLPPNTTYRTPSGIINTTPDKQ